MHSIFNAVRLRSSRRHAFSANAPLIFRNSLLVRIHCIMASKSRLGTRHTAPCLPSTPGQGRCIVYSMQCDSRRLEKTRVQRTPPHSEIPYWCASTVWHLRVWHSPLRGSGPSCGPMSPTQALYSGCAPVRNSLSTQGFKGTPRMVVNTWQITFDH